MDATPQVLVGPVRQRVVLPQPPALVAFDQLRVRARRPLLAADAGDPALGVGERRFERCHLGDRAAVLRAAPRLLRVARVLHLDLHAEALLERAPGRERLREQHARVDRHDPHGFAGSLVQAQQLVEQHRLLLLEGAQQHGARAVAGGLAQRVREAQRRVDVDRCYVAVRWAHGIFRLVFVPLRHLEDIYTAHSPSPRITSNGTLRFQSMNVFIVSNPKSTGSDSSFTRPSSSAVPMRWVNGPHSSPSARLAS